MGLEIVLCLDHNKRIVFQVLVNPMDCALRAAYKGRGKERGPMKRLGKENTKALSQFGYKGFYKRLLH